MKITIVFDKNSVNWEYSSQAWNQMFVTAQVHYLEEKYLSGGYLYFEQIYTALGLTWDPYDENKCWIHDRDGDLKFIVANKSSSNKIEITIHN